MSNPYQEPVLLSPIELGALVNKLRIVIVEDVEQLLRSGSLLPSKAPGDQNYLSRQELAEKLNVSPNTIANWENRGRIPSLRFGSVVRYDFHAVVEALNKHKKRLK
jgi:excisionase family DNA binding protein